MGGSSAKADNRNGATHSSWKCLNLLPTKYAIGAILPSNSWSIISAIFTIGECIVTCLHAGFATDWTLRFQLKEPTLIAC